MYKILLLRIICTACSSQLFLSSKGHQAMSWLMCAQESLISCERGCQRGPEWAVWNFCQTVSNFHRPHCGPCPAYGCSSMGLLLGHPWPFIVHLAMEHEGRGGLHCTTPGRYANPRAQNKTKATLSRVYWKLISYPPSFHIHNRQS